MGRELTRASITGGIVVFYIGGALLSGYLQLFWQVKTLIIPIILLLVVAIWQFVIENLILHHS